MVFSPLENHLSSNLSVVTFFSLVVDIIGCAFRGGYGAAGPLFIGNVWYSIEVFGLAMPTPIHTLSTLMAAIVFIRLDVFGLLKRKKVVAFY